ncbi:FAD/NAD(P)-binding domain-containing protein [Apodospora peruviana]|uniref:FAD/NAD(P)-binding domain-containing protein n=1 Tax=Apodospora peruviana TaxID=516989 RepID=A0AAE0MBQ8_9PEZI|nr:FAD/NAD(P)-binding domain-containing protein [Apodospora peruviana]
MGSQTPKHFDVRKIAIIGAGPSGLTAAKYLTAQGAFDSIVIFEQQSEVGGVWNYSPRPSQILHVPQTSAFCPPDPPLRSRGTPPVFPSPMYEVLHTNIPRSLMQFSDLAFPSDSLIFPTREHVQEYLVTYAQDIRHLIRFSAQVQDVRLRQVDGRDQWYVDVLALGTGEVTTATYDAVVVASGHFSVTCIPEIKGLVSFHEAHPRIVTHSKLYRTSAAFVDKKVIVVGNSASGLDISSQISRVCRKPLLLSVRTATPPTYSAFIGAEELPEIEEFLVEERGVRFRDGRIEKDIDAVVFATGYLFTFPFLTSFKPPLVTDGRRVYGTYKHLFSIDHPTIVFPGLPIKVVPFAVSESQAAVCSRVWANELPLPSRDEMRRWEEEEAEKRGPKFHFWPKGGDGAYINSVYDWIAKSGTKGKVPPRWDGELLWERQVCFDAKLEFEIKGCGARSLGELGFEYQPEKIGSDGRDDSSLL